MVGETWSALVALWQSRHAATRELRATYARIADDEIRHAQIARDLAVWANERLRPAARARVEVERRAAVVKLGRQIARGPAEELVHELGLPDVTAARRLYTRARPLLAA